MIKIVSKGTPETTQILDENDKPIEGITRIELLPITANCGFIEAELTFEAVQFELICNETGKTYLQKLQDILEQLNDAFITNDADLRYYDEQGVNQAHRELTYLIEDLKNATA